VHAGALRASRSTGWEPLLYNVVMLQNISHCCQRYNPPYVFTQIVRDLMPDCNHVWCSLTASPKVPLRNLTKILPVVAALMRSDLRTYIHTDGRTDKVQLLAALSRVYHYWKIRARKQRRDIGKYSFVNRSITDWNRLPEGARGASYGKTHILKMRFRKVKNSEGK